MGATAQPLNASERTRALEKLGAEELDVLVIGGGVVGAGTLIYALVTPGAAAPKSGVSIAPLVATQGGGMLVSGRW